MLNRAVVSAEALNSTIVRLIESLGLGPDNTSDNFNSTIVRLIVSKFFNATCIFFPFQFNHCTINSLLLIKIGITK